MSEPPPRLYLIASGSHGPTPSRLAEALAAGDVACVMFSGPGLTPETLAERVRVVQSRDAAALLAGDEGLVARMDADGMHVEAGPGLREAVRRMKPARIVGAGGLVTRDDAMAAGELDVDYLLFGEDMSGTVPSFEERLGRVAWWAEIFQVPCVAVAYRLDEVAPFVESGAEFVALGDLVWTDARGPAAPVREAMDALHRGHAAFLARQGERM